MLDHAGLDAVRVEARQGKSTQTDRDHWVSYSGPSGTVGAYEALLGCRVSSLLEHWVNDLWPNSLSLRSFACNFGPWTCKITTEKGCLKE